MNELDFILEEKAVDDEGHIEGLAAAYSNVDEGGDVIVPGALTKSVGGRTTMPMLLYHDHRQPVGVWTGFAENSKGLKVKGRFSLTTNAGREAHALAKDGALGALSIGYRTVKERFKAQVRELLEITLHEVSLVAVPMNERAMITSVKSNELRDRLAAGDRLSEREMEMLLKTKCGLSNSEAERAVRLHFKKGQGEPGGTANDEARAFLEAIAG